MTREEAHTLLEVMAIELIGELANNERPVTERTKLLGKQLKAIDMAIEALQAEPTHDRLIDADALMEYCSNQKTKTISNNDIARFPTAPYVADLVRCKDCKHQEHCHETVAHTKEHDGFREHWSESIEWCSRGERKGDENTTKESE